MEIRDKSGLENYPAYVKQVRNEPPNTGSRNSANVRNAPDGDNVHLSPAARQIQEAKKTIAALTDVDETKVAQIRNQIQEGTYRIDTRRVAAKMIEDAFLGRNTRGDATD